MPPARRSRFQYDVFISYSHRNKEWVREWLVPHMQNAGLTVCIDIVCIRLCLAGEA